MDPLACNIGPNEIKKRQTIGLALIVVAGFSSGMLVAVHAPWYFRIAVFPLFMGGFVSLLQAQKKVCVYHAWKKTKNMN